MPSGRKIREPSMPPSMQRVRGEKLRTGWTTGTCAAAAAKAAAKALVSGEAQEEVEVRLPRRGEERRVKFEVERCEAGEGCAEAVVVKDAGDDPDVTHLAEIRARVWRRGESGLLLAAGTGVGTVTRPGLGLEVGAPAINPVPRRMIAEHLDAIAGDVIRSDGLVVEISIPNGEALAKKTLNGRLGIVGGLSILGTTGIVLPYSTAAWRASVEQAIDVAAANGQRHVVLSTGGRSEQYAQRLIDLPDLAFVEMGEFTGHALKRCAKLGVRAVTLAGMIGKMSKIALGHFMTHVAGNQVDPHYLAQLAYECGASAEFRDELRGANTARHFQELILERGGPRSVFDRICSEVCARGFDLVKGQLTLEAFLFDFDGSVLGHARSPVAGATR